MSAEKFQLEKFVADLAGPRVEARGVVQEIAGEKSFELKATAHQFEMNTLGYYWPTKIADIAREWMLENLSDGTMPQVRAAISGDGAIAMGSLWIRLSEIWRSRAWP